MRKVMVIDDDPNTVEIVREALRYAGHEVVGETSTRAAVKRVQDEMPEILLLDLMMPGLDGWQILELLLGDPRTADISIIILTAAAHSLPDLQAFYGDAVRGYLTKPFDLDVLIELVNTVPVHTNDGAESERVTDP